MKSQSVIVICVVLEGLALSVHGDERDRTVRSMSRHDCAVLIVEKVGEARHRAGCGTLIKDGEALSLVTTVAIANQFSESAMLKLPAVEQFAERELRFDRLSTQRKLSWIKRETSPHLAAMRLEVPDEEDGLRKHLHSVSVSFDSLESEVPPRATRIEVVGYSAMLARNGTLPAVPLVFTSFTVSGAVSTAAASDTNAVFWSSEISGRPFGGCPVFIASDDASDMKCAGLFMEHATDPNGGVLCGVIPARAIGSIVK